MADKNIEVMLKGVRLSFADIFEPKEGKDDAGRPNGRYTYSANFLIPKDTDEGKALIAKLRAAMKDAREAQWPTADGKEPKKFKADRMCLRDGDEENWDGYAGHMYVSANRGVKNKDDPSPIEVIDSRKGADGKFPRLTARDGRPYSGCFVNAIIRIYGYDGSKNDHPDRINASLEAIQFVRHGEAFGAKKVDADSAFEDEGAEDDDFGTENKSAGGSAASDDDDDMLG